MPSPSSGTPEKPAKVSLWRQIPASGRAFCLFWGGCTALGGLLALTLQMMGPPYAEVGGEDIDVGTTSPAAIAALAHKIDIPAPIGDLLSNEIGPGGFALPKPGPQGLLPRQAYAAPVVPVPAGNAQVALLIDGIGEADEALSNQAMDTLPGPVSLAVSPYVADAASLMERARTHQHETLLSLPVDDSASTGAQTGKDTGANPLQASLGVEKNLENLDAILSHLAGYAGVTNAFSGQNGGAYPQSAAFRPLLSALTRRGLLYLNVMPAPQSGQTPAPRAITDKAGSVGTADVVIRTDADIVTIDILLLKLQQLARKNGHAIGVMGPLRPVALSCLKAWIPNLKTVGITLVPVSMVISPPPATPAAPKPPPKPTAADGAMHVQITPTPPDNRNSPAPSGHL